MVNPKHVIDYIYLIAGIILVIIFSLEILARFYHASHHCANVRRYGSFQVRYQRCGFLGSLLVFGNGLLLFKDWSAVSNVGYLYLLRDNCNFVIVFAAFITIYEVFIVCHRQLYDCEQPQLTRTLGYFFITVFISSYALVLAGDIYIFLQNNTTQYENSFRAYVCFIYVSVFGIVFGSMLWVAHDVKRTFRKVFPGVLEESERESESGHDASQSEDVCLSRDGGPPHQENRVNSTVGPSLGSGESVTIPTAIGPKDVPIAGFRHHHTHQVRNMSSSFTSNGSQQVQEKETPGDLAENALTLRRTMKRVLRLANMTQLFALLGMIFELSYGVLLSTKLFYYNGTESYKNEFTYVLTWLQYLCLSVMAKYGWVRLTHDPNGPVGGYYVEPTNSMVSVCTESTIPMVGATLIPSTSTQTLGQE